MILSSLDNCPCCQGSGRWVEWNNKTTIFGKTLVELKGMIDNWEVKMYWKLWQEAFDYGAKMERERIKSVI